VERTHLLPIDYHIILNTSFFYLRHHCGIAILLSTLQRAARRRALLKRQMLSQHVFKISNYRHHFWHRGYQLVGCRAKGEGIQKHAKQFLKQAGEVRLQRRSHAA
jgi:hypothetical protein